MGSNRGGKNFLVHSRYDGRREFFQHDDRSEQQPRRNKFSGRGGGHYYQNEGGSGGGGSNRYQRGNRRGQGNYRRTGYGKLPHEDISMEESKGGHRQQFYEQARGKRRNYNGKGRPFHAGTSGWHKIIVKDASSYPKEEVLSAIRELVDDSFIPIMFEAEGNNYSFYLEKNPGVARAILNLSGRLTLRGNHKVYIASTDTIPPYRKLTPPQMEIVKAVMSERYSGELNRLDLKNFHNDQTLINNQVYCPLHRNNYLVAILEIILTNCPAVEEIDMGHNSISSMHPMGDLKNCTNLKRLSLEKNNIRSLDLLMKLKGLGIIELTLEGNPLCDKFKEANSYTSAVREIFPKVVRLDGIELPKPIGFEVEDEVELPPTLPSFFCSDEIKSIVVTFIEQYFQVFESDSRKPLEAAYTEDALFSLASNFPETGFNAKYVGIFERDNRNLKKVTNLEKRIGMLYRGRSQVGEALSRLPKCLHDPNSFVIDIPIARPCLLHVVLTGVFKQIADKQPPVRSFMKSMVIVPVGSGFCISNEELYINNATVDQIRKAFKEPAQPSTTAAISSPQANPVASPSAVLEPVQLQLIQQFAVHSKMLPEFCKMCLEKNNWDFNKAGEMFLTLQKENKIPPEYFGLPAT